MKARMRFIGTYVIAILFWIRFFGTADLEVCYDDEVICRLHSWRTIWQKLTSRKK